MKKTILTALCLTMISFSANAQMTCKELSNTYQPETETIKNVETGVAIQEALDGILNAQYKYDYTKTQVNATEALKITLRAYEWCSYHKKKFGHLSVVEGYLNWLQEHAMY